MHCPVRNPINALFDPGDPSRGLGVDCDIKRIEGAAEPHAQSLDEGFLAGPARQKCQRTAVGRKRSERRGLRRRKEALRQVVGIRKLANQLDVDADRATARKRIDSKNPGMREIELQIYRPMHGRKSRLAVLCLDEFDCLGGNAQALAKEPPQVRAGYGIVQPMLGVAEFPCAFLLLARQ